MKIINNRIHFLLFLFLSISFIFIIPPEKYPDNDVLENRLITNHKDLTYSSQTLFLKIYNVLYVNIICNQNKKEDCSILKLIDLSRLNFYIPTFSLFMFLYFLNHIFFRKKILLQYKKQSNFIVSLCFPATLLSITSISSEATYTLISIFIMLNFKILQKINFKSIILIILGIYCLYLDRGNFIVFISFILGFILLLILRYYVNFKVFIIAFTSIFILLIGIKQNIFTFFENFIDSEKLIGLLLEVERLNLDQISLLDLFLRVIYFWVTLIMFIFPDKSILFIWSLMIPFTIIFYLNRRSRIVFINRSNIFFKDSYNQVLYLWLFIFPIVIIYLLPTHAYSKYYLFYIPVLISALQTILNIKHINILTFLIILISLIEYIFRFY